MKRKVWDITVKDNPNRVVMGENDEFYTTDTEAYLVFKLDDENFSPESAVLTLENRNDGSLKNETVDVVDGLIEWEMPQRYIEHFGNWQGQLVYEDTKDGQPELYTSATFTFVVNAHIGDKKMPSLVEIENWEKFIRDGTELIETWEDMEDLRQANEAQRQANYQELLDTGVLQSNINTKLEELEEEYAPTFAEVTTRLAHTESKFSVVSIKDFPRLAPENEDSARINRAIESMDKGILQLHDETYNTTHPIKIKSDIVIQGVGKNSTSIVNNNNTNIIETLDRDSRYYYSGVNDLTLNGTTKDTQTGLDISNVSYFSSTNLSIRNVNVGIYMFGRNQNGGVLGCYYNTITNPLIAGTDIGIYFDNIANENVVFGGKIMTSNTATIMNANSCKFFGTAFEGNYEVHVHFKNFGNSLFGCRFEGFNTATALVSDLSETFTEQINFVYSPHFEGVLKNREDINGKLFMISNRGLDIPVHLHRTVLKSERTTVGDLPMVDMKDTGHGTTYSSTRRTLSGDHFSAFNREETKIFSLNGSGHMFLNNPSAGLHLTSADGTRYRVRVSNAGELEVIKV